MVLGQSFPILSLYQPWQKLRRFDRFEAYAALAVSECNVPVWATIVALV